MRAILLVTLALAALPQAQDRDYGPQERLHLVAQTYRDKGTRAALDMLARDEAKDQRRAAKEVVATHGIAAGAAARSDPREPVWTIALLRAAGAVHMEAALEIYERDERNLNPIVAQVEIGEILLEEVARLEEARGDAPQWEWVIGQQAMVDGWFDGARSILTRACDRYEREAALLIACGTVYETFASSGVDGAQAVARALRGMGELGQIRPASTVARYRDARKEDLKRARSAFERAADIDSSTVEAVLRLGKVRLDQGDPDDAAAILERLLTVRMDKRTTYLARLFLGRVREKQKRFEDAVSLFREAIATVPAQSARLALANRLHAGGRNDEARTLVDAATTERDIEDPWWSYRMGRYWLIEPMLAAVRQRSKSSTDKGQ